VDNAGGTDPKWNSNVRLKEDNSATALLLEIMAENIVLDEVIGQVTRLVCCVKHCCLN
jgi:hypothetical protein